MALTIVYPYCYDTIQLMKSGRDYFKDTWNITDFIYMYIEKNHEKKQAEELDRHSNTDAGRANCLLMIMTEFK